jgi:hypothetical protein
MASASSEIDEQIERLRKGDTLAENEVKALCEKVSMALCSRFSEDMAPEELRRVASRHLDC